MMTLTQQSEPKSDQALQHEAELFDEMAAGYDEQAEVALKREGLMAYLERKQMAMNCRTSAYRLRKQLDARWEGLA